MKLSMVQGYYQRYLSAVSRYGYRTVNQCYKTPSVYKISAESDIVTEVFARGGYGYTVISYNTTMFTCGYLFTLHGEMYFAVHTPSDYGVLKVSEFAEKEG